MSWHTMCTSASGNTSLQCGHCVIEYNIYVHLTITCITIKWVSQYVTICISRSRNWENVRWCTTEEGMTHWKVTIFTKTHCFPSSNCLWAQSTTNREGGDWHKKSSTPQHMMISGTTVHYEVLLQNVMVMIMENLASETTEDQPTVLENSFGDNKVSMVRKLAGMVCYLQ